MLGCSIYSIRSWVLVWGRQSSLVRKKVVYNLSYGFLHSILRKHVLLGLIRALFFKINLQQDCNFWAYTCIHLIVFPIQSLDFTFLWLNRRMWHHQQLLLRGEDMRKIQKLASSIWGNKHPHLCMNNWCVCIYIYIIYCLCKYIYIYIHILLYIIYIYILLRAISWRSKVPRAANAPCWYSSQLRAWVSIAGNRRKMPWEIP